MREQAIVILKRSTWDQLKFNVADSSAAKRAFAVHQRHSKSVDRVLHELSKLKYRAVVVNGPEKEFKVPEDTRVVITVGGDGTLLAASHKVPAGIPILGVNSDPKTSVGYLCAARAEDVRGILLAKNFKSSVKKITRLQVSIDGEVVCSRVLNEALFSHVCPAAMTKFILGQDRYGCSGIWVGTGAGSTGAMRSAGGTSYPPETKELQAIIREPYRAPGKTLNRFQSGKSFKLISKVSDGILYLDGPFLSFPVEYEQQVNFRVSPEPLTMVMT